MSASRASLRVAVLGGGNGIPTVLAGLADRARSGDQLEITAIVATADDGGSSGRLRSERGGLPPGDLRNCLVALSENTEGALARLFSHRFDGSGGLAGHALGNLILMALAEREGSYLEAVRAAGRLLGARGRVLPVSLQALRLEGQTVAGERLSGESRIGASPAAVHRVWLEPSAATPTPGVLDALRAADLVVLGPGSLFTSLLPVLLVDGVADAVRDSAAVRVLVGNLMTQPGETIGMSFADHLEALDRHVGGALLDVVILNDAPIATDRLAPYAQQHAHLVSRRGLEARPESVLEVPVANDTGKIRHEPARLADVLIRLAVEPERVRPHSDAPGISPRGGPITR